MLPRRLTAEDIANQRYLTPGELDEIRIVEDGMRQFYAARYRKDERKRLWRSILWAGVVVTAIACAVMGILHH